MQFRFLKVEILLNNAFKISSWEKMRSAEMGMTFIVSSRNKVLGQTYQNALFWAFQAEHE